MSESEKSHRVFIRMIKNGQLINLLDVPFKFRKIRLSKLVYSAESTERVMVRIETNLYDKTILRDFGLPSIGNLCFFAIPSVAGASELLMLNQTENGYDYEFETSDDLNSTSFVLKFYEDNVLVTDAHFATFPAFIEILFIR
jgi:hypothetical protein